MTISRDSLRQSKYGVWVIPLASGFQLWEPRGNISLLGMEHLNGGSCVLPVVVRSEEPLVDGMGVLGKAPCSLILQLDNIQPWEGW